MYRGIKGRQPSRMASGGPRFVSSARVAEEYESITRVQRMNALAMSASLGAASGELRIAPSAIPLLTQRSSAAKRGGRRTIAQQTTEGSLAPELLAPVGGPGPRPAASAHVKRGGVRAAKVGDSQESRAAPPKSANQGFRQLLSRRNMLSMQDQRDESKNLAKWLNQRNAMGKHSVKRTGTISSGWLQASLPVPAFVPEQPVEVPTPQPQAVTVPSKVVPEKQISTARAAPIGFNKMRFSDATDIQTQYPAGVEEQRGNEGSVITPADPLTANPASARTSAVLQPQQPSGAPDSAPWRQLRQRAGHGTLEPTESQGPQNSASSGARLLTQSFFHTQNLVMGFQPILQNKVVGPYVKGPIYVEDRTRKGKDSPEPRYNSHRSRQKQSRFQLLQVGASDDGGQEGKLVAAATIPVGEAGQLQSSWRASRKPKPRVITGREKRLHLGKGSGTGSLVHSPPDTGVSRGVLPATLGADTSPAPATDAEDAESSHLPAENPAGSGQADVKELSSEHRQSPGQPVDQQSRTILSKKSGQITFDITRGDLVGRESPAAGASALRRALKSSQLRAMLTKEDLVLLNRLPQDQKSKMIEYLNSVFASKVEQGDPSRIDSGTRLSPGPAIARSDGLSGLAQLAQLAQIAQIMQLAELARSGQSDQDDLPELTLSASQVSILSDLTQSALNQEKKLLQDVAQVIGEAERSLMPLTRRNRLIQSGTLRGRDAKSFQAREVDKFQNILQNKMESFKASMRRQMELQRHVLIEGLHKRVKAGKEGFQQIRIESLSPDNIWRLSQILKVQKENYEKSLEFHNMMEGLKQASQGPPQTVEAVSQSFQSSTWRKSAKRDAQREATLITIPSGEAQEQKPGKPLAAPERRGAASRNARVGSPRTVEFDNTLQPSGGPCSDKGAASPGRACLAPSQLKQLSASSERDLHAMLHNNTFDSHGIKNFSEGMPNGNQMEQEPALSPPVNAKFQTKGKSREDDVARNIKIQNEDLRILGQHEEARPADPGHHTIAPSLVAGSAYVKKRDLIGSSRDPAQLLPQSARTAAVPVMDTKRTPVVIPTIGDQSNFEHGADVSSSFHRYEHGNASFVRVDAFDDVKEELKLLWPPKQAPEKDLKHKTMKPRGKGISSTNTASLNKHSKSYQSQVNLRQQSIRRANQQNSLGLVRQLSPQVAKLDSHVVQGESAKLFAPSGQRIGNRRGMVSGRTQGPGASPDSNEAQKHVLQRVMTAPGELDAKFQSIQPASAVYVNLKTPITQRLSRTAQQRMRNMQNARRATQMNRGDKDRQVQDGQGISIVHQKLLSPRASWMKIQQSGRGSLITSSRTRRLPSGDHEEEKVTKEQLPPLMMNSRAQLKVNNCLKSIESEKLDPRMVDNYELQVETQRIDKETPFGQRGTAPAKKSQSTSKVAQVSKLESKTSQNNKLEGNLLLGQGLGRTVAKAATNIVTSEDSNNNEMLNLPGRPSQAEPALESRGGVTSAQNVKKGPSTRTAARGGHTELLRGDSLTLRDGGSPMSYNVVDQRLDDKLKTTKMQTRQEHPRTSKPQAKGVMTPQNERPEAGPQSSQVRMPRVVYQQSKHNEYELLSPGSSAWPEESDGTIQGLLNTAWRPAASPKDQEYLHSGVTEGGGPPLNVSSEPHNIQNMLYLYEKKTPGKSGPRPSHRACQSVAHSNQNASPTKEYNTDIVHALDKKQEESSRPSKLRRPSGGQQAQANETQELAPRPKNEGGEAAGDHGHRNPRMQEAANQKAKSHSITHGTVLSPEEHQELRVRDGQGSQQVVRTSPPLQQGSDKISNSMNMTIDHFDNLPQTRPPPRLAANNEAFKASAGFMQYIQPFQSSKIPELIREQANDELVSTSRHAEQVDGRVPSSGGHDFIENLIQTMQKEQQIFGEVLGKIDSSKNTFSRRSSREHDQNDFGDLNSAKEAARTHSLEKKLAQQLESLHVSDGTSDPVKLQTTSTEARRRQVLRKTSGPMASAKERKIQRMPTEVKGCGLVPMVLQEGVAKERKDPSAAGAPSLIVGHGRGFNAIPKALSSLKASPRGSLDLKDQVKIEESVRNDRIAPIQDLEDNAQRADIVIQTGRRIAEPKDEESSLSKLGTSKPAGQEQPALPRRRTTKSRTGGQQYSSRYRQHHLQKGLVLSQKQMAATNPYRNRKDEKRGQAQKKPEEVVQRRVQAKVQLDVRGSQKIINGKLVPGSLVIPQALDIHGDSSKRDSKAKKVRTQEPAPSFGAFPSRQHNFRIKNAEVWTAPPTQSLSPKHSSAKSVVVGTACRREPILRHLRSGLPKLASKTHSTLPAAARLNVDIGPVGDVATPRPREEAERRATEHPGPLPTGNHSLHVEVRNEAASGRHSTDHSPRAGGEADQEVRGPRADLRNKAAVALEAKPASNLLSEAANRARSSHNVTAYILVQSPQSPGVFDPNAQLEDDDDK